MHKGPYFILASLKTPSAGNFQHLSICKLIYGTKGAISFERANRNAVKVTFNTATEANDAMLLLHNSEKIKAIIPKSSLFRLGVISSVPQEFTDDELFENIESQTPIASIRRILRFNNGVHTPTFSVGN